MSTFNIGEHVRARPRDLGPGGYFEGVVEQVCCNTDGRPNGILKVRITQQGASSYARGVGVHVGARVCERTAG